MNVEKLLTGNLLCDRLGIKYPVIQAGMGLVANSQLAAAVSEAGGMGVIGAGRLGPDELRDEIRNVRRLTSQPFGVDILFGKVQQSDATSERYSDLVEAQIDVSLEERVPLLVSGLGSPRGVVKRAHDLGIVVMSVVGNVRQAKRVEADGVDIIVASGSDGGGHVGRVGTASLVPAVVDAVSAPVVAAGGLADGRGLVAAFAFGAVGIWLGTRFIATDESRSHMNYKQKLVDIDEEGTVISRALSGKTVRAIRNRFTESWAAREDEIEPFPLQLLNVGDAASYKGRIEGDVENGALPAGQSAALIHSVKSAGDVVLDIMEEARTVLERWAGAATEAQTALTRV